MRNSSKNSLKILLSVFFQVLFWVISMGNRPIEAGVLVDRVLAVAGAEVITQSDLDRLLHSGNNLEKLGEKQRYWALLNQLIEERLVVQAARRRGLRVSEEEIEFALEDIEERNGIPDRGSFKEAVSRENISWDQYVANLKSQLLALKLLNREINSKLKLSEGAAQTYYDSYPERFRLPERVRLRQILLKFSPGGTDAAQKTLREQGKKIYSELREGGDFIQLVKKYSEGSAREKEGDLGFFRKGELADKMDQAVFSLQEGEVSLPIESGRGIHLFKVEERQTERWIEFEKVRRDIEDKLLSEKRISLRKKWMDDLWEKSFVEIKK